MNFGIVILDYSIFFSHLTSDSRNPTIFRLWTEQLQEEWENFHLPWGLCPATHCRRLHAFKLKVITRATLANNPHLSILDRLENIDQNEIFGNVLFLIYTRKIARTIVRVFCFACKLIQFNFSLKFMQLK